VKTRRIRRINILELDHALYNSTYNAGLEMANCFNASIHVCILESEENKMFNQNQWIGVSSKKFVENLIDDASENRQLLKLGLSFDEFSENKPLKDIFNGLLLNESVTMLGYNKSFRHKEVLNRLIKEELGSPLMLIPNGKDVKSFHKIVVPFEPEFVTKKKLLGLKWIVDQLGVMVDFVHVKKQNYSHQVEGLDDVFELVKNWVEDLGFCSKITFKCITGENFHSALGNYIKKQKNCFICIVDRQIKNTISLSFSNNEECLMDIKEPVVIL
jgi:hypothetical protein